MLRRRPRARRREPGRWRRRILPVGLALAPLLCPASSLSRTYENYFRYLGNHPKEVATYWADNVQGITNDGAVWFISQTLDLWIVPMGCDLSDEDSDPCPGVVHASLTEYPQLFAPGLPSRGYNHIGDIDYHLGFLLVPLECEAKGGMFDAHVCEQPAGGPARPAIAAFDVRSHAFAYVDHAVLPVDEGVQDYAGWCAVNPRDRLLYSGGGWQLQRYEVDWELLQRSADLALSYAGPYEIVDEVGLQIEFDTMQGGVFSPTGDLLYLVNGYYEYDGDFPDWGIHVIDTALRRRIGRSSNGGGLFDYEFHPNWSRYEEPEGVTIVDVDDGRAPGVRGQLHVLLLDNELTSDDVYLKHYTNRVYVREGSLDGDGRIDSPFATVQEGYDFSWGGSILAIGHGTYEEALTLSRDIKIVSWDGIATIGARGRIVLAPDAAVALVGGGSLKLHGP